VNRDYPDARGWTRAVLVLALIGSSRDGLPDGDRAVHHGGWNRERSDHAIRRRPVPALIEEGGQDDDPAGLVAGQRARSPPARGLR